MRTLLACAVLVGWAVPASGEPPLPQVRVVFLTPADVEPPDGVAHRLTQVAEATETLFVKWMKAWDYPAQREQIFQRDPDGNVHIDFVKAEETLASGRFPLQDGNLARKGKLLAMQRYDIPKALDIWWVWVYVGDPPLKYSSYLGSGNAATGGLCQVNYVNLPGEIGSDDRLAQGLAEKLTLKGTIHEFGHALGLPHNGPLEKSDLGMPLMGATIRNYRRRMKNDEDRVYLTEASAAILWKHPLFTGTAERRNVLPKITWHNLTVDNNQRQRIAHLRGRVSSNVPVHSVLVYDTVPEIQQTYFQKPYVARVGADGTFDVTISEPVNVRADGVLKLVACCENGTMTGNGTSRGIGSGHELRYRTSRTGYRLQTE